MTQKFVLKMFSSVHVRSKWNPTLWAGADAFNLSMQAEANKSTPGSTENAVGLGRNDFHLF
jgi:hypothetical protein